MNHVQQEKTGNDRRNKENIGKSCFKKLFERPVPQRLHDTVQIN